MFLAVPLSKFALSLGPSEECVLVFAILTLVAHLYESRAGVDADAATRSFPPVIGQMIDSWKRVSL